MKEHSTNPTKICTKCKETKPLSAFGLHHGKKGSKPRSHSWCRACKNTGNRANYARRRLNGSNPNQASHLRLMYGLSVEDYQAAFARQNGVCAICHQAETSIHPRSQMVRNLSVDHDHETGAFRGLLCHSCNRALGLFKDDPAIIQSAVYYLNQDI